MCAELSKSGGAIGCPLLHVSVLDSILAIQMLSGDRAALAAPGNIEPFQTGTAGGLCCKPPAGSDGNRLRNMPHTGLLFVDVLSINPLKPLLS